MEQLSAEIKKRARSLGFDLVGIAPAEPSRYREYLRDWLDSGQAGAMEYLKRRFDERVDPAAYLPGARSVICVAVNYHTPLAAEPREYAAGSGQQAADSSFIIHHSSFPPDPHPNPLPEYRERGQGRIARYALGDDYHDLLKGRLHKLADWMRTQVPDAQTRCAVDTAPVMEKELAARAGVGWIGKNTCVINPQIGSWVLLGEIITTLDLPPDDPAVDRCGTCQRCIDACPTQAITGPYQLDARRCISYLTIELRDEIPAEFRAPMSDWLYGCDICQDVCPWNGKAPVTTDPAFQPRFPTGGIDLHEVMSWRDEDYRQHLRGSAMRRVKLPVLQRNARIVMENFTKRRSQD